MKVKLYLKRQYNTRDRDNKDVIVRTIEASREIEIPTKFLPSHLLIGGNDFYKDGDFYDVDHGHWVLFVSAPSLGRDDLHASNEYVASLENTGWKILKDEKSIEVVSFSLTRSDAIALIEAAREGLKARNPKIINRPRWNENRPWSTLELEDAIRSVCRSAAKQVN